MYIRRCLIKGCRFSRCARITTAAASITLCWLLSSVPASRAESAPTPTAAAPLKVGLGASLSGAEAHNGRQILIALQLWRDDVNAQGGLLGRKIDLVTYDDQSNPAIVPRMYYKLITEDKVDLLLGPYGSNTAAAAMRVVMNFNKLTIGILGISVNRIFSYWRYFSMAPFGAEGIKALSKGFFDLAAAQMPRPKTAAILAGDATFTAALATSARDSASEVDFNVIYDERYAPTADFTPVMRTLKQANADVVFLAADEAHTAGMIRAAREAALAPSVLGGAMAGLLDARVKAELGPSLDGIVAVQNFVPAPTLSFPDLGALMQRYRAAADPQPDPIGYSYVPFGYAAGQVLAQAVKDTNSLDPDQLAAYMHGHRFATVVGEIAYDENGEWSTPRPVFTQFQNVAEGDVGQFSDTKVQPIVWPSQYRTADVIYPYSAASKK